jgi:hypothetical protein
MKNRTLSPVFLLETPMSDETLAVRATPLGANLTDTSTAPVAVATEPTVVLTGAQHAAIKSLLDIMEGHLDTVEAFAYDSVAKAMDVSTAAYTKEVTGVLNTLAVKYRADVLAVYRQAQHEYTTTKLNDIRLLRTLIGADGIDQSLV